MRLLDLRKTSDTGSQATYRGAITLDELWGEAAKIGTVTKDKDFGKGEYVQIMFERKTGSRIYARGYHSDIREAFRLAIEEARALS